MEIKSTELLSYVATVKSQNEATYSVTSDVSVSKDIITNFTNGIVTRVSDNVNVATFMLTGNLNINYQVSDVEVQKAILDSINSFISTCNTNSKSLLP